MKIALGRLVAGCLVAGLLGCTSQVVTRTNIPASLTVKIQQGLHVTNTVGQVTDVGVNIHYTSVGGGFTTVPPDQYLDVPVGNASAVGFSNLYPGHVVVTATAFDVGADISSQAGNLPVEADLTSGATTQVALALKLNPTPVPHSDVSAAVTLTDGDLVLQ